MAIELNEVKTIAQSQRFIFENVVIQRNPELVANIQFQVVNEKGERIGTQNYEYRGEAFNTFWSNFNSGKFLYDELVKKSMLNIAVDETVENDFVYVKPPEPVAPVVENIPSEEPSVPQSTSTPEEVICDPNNLDSQRANDGAE